MTSNNKTAERLEPEVDQSLNGRDGSLVGRSPTVEEIAQRAYEKSSTRLRFRA